MTTRVTEGARRGDTRKGRLSLFFSATALASRVLRFCRSTLARTFTPLAKSKEKELLLAVNGKSSGSSNLVPRILSPSSLQISRLAGGPWERLGFDRVCSKKEHNILLAVLVHFYNYANNYASFNKLCSF